MNHFHWRRSLVVGGAAAFAASRSQAADASPLRILVGYPPGGSADALARVLGEGLMSVLGRPVLVENRAGAGGRLAAEALARGPADGSVLMLAPNGLTSIQTITYRGELRYDPARDWAPVALLVNSSLAVAVSNESGISHVRGLRAWLQGHPDKAMFGSPAVGGLPHFAGLMVGKALGVPIRHVPYKGGGPVAVALIGNEVPMGVSAIADFAAHHRAGRLKVVGILDAQRSPLSPGIATFREQGADLVMPNWSGLWTRAGTPEQVIRDLSLAVEKVMAQTGFKARMFTQMNDLAYGGPSVLMRLQQREWDEWAPIIKSSGFKPD